MCGKKLMESTELYCYKVTGDDGEVRYIVAVSAQDAITHSEEIQGVKICEYVGLGGIADV